MISDVGVDLSEYANAFAYFLGRVVGDVIALCLVLHLTKRGLAAMRIYFGGDPYDDWEMEKRERDNAQNARWAASGKSLKEFMKDEWDSGRMG